MNSELITDMVRHEYSLRWTKVLLRLGRPLFTAVMLIGASILVHFDVQQLHTTRGMLIGALIVAYTFGIPFALLVNYYAYCRDRILTISDRGDEFTFGTEGELQGYSKAQISSIFRCTVNNFRYPWNGYAYFKVCFNDGSFICIPNLMINDEEISKGLGVDTEIQSTWFPFVREPGDGSSV